MGATFRWAMPSRTPISVVQALASRPQPLHVSADKDTHAQCVTGPRDISHAPCHQRHVELVFL